MIGLYKLVKIQKRYETYDSNDCPIGDLLWY